VALGIHFPATRVEIPSGISPSRSLCYFPIAIGKTELAKLRDGRGERNASLRAVAVENWKFGK